MASSSDWIALARDAARPSASVARGSAPEWLASPPSDTAFIAGMPFAAPATTTDSAQCEPALSQEVCNEPDEMEPVEAPGPSTDPVVEARALGFQEGRAAAQAEYQAESEHARALRLTFQTLDQAASDALAQELCDTVEALCSAAIGSFEPGARDLQERCRAAAQHLGGAPGAFTLHLHPQDIELIGPESLSNWTVHADANVPRGGLRFEGPDGSVTDGPDEWRRAIAAALRS